MTSSQPSSDPSWPPDPDTAPLDNAVPVKVTKEVNLAQLQAEVTEAAGLNPGEVNMTITGAPDPSEPLGDDNYEVLWTTPPSIDISIIETAVADHVPDPEFGITAQQRTFEEALAKVTQDADAELSDEEIRALAVGAALRSMAR